MSINYLKLSLKIYQFNDDLGCRFSLLDMIAFLYISQNPLCGKLDIAEFINHDRIRSKSSLDRPVDRLVSVGIVERVYNDGAATITGEPRVMYQLSDKGQKLIDSCKYNVRNK